MLKKFIIYILVAAMLFTVPTSFATEETVNENVYSIGFFEALGVIDNASDYYAKLDERMTRADFAALVAGLFKNAAVSSSNENIFKDVDASHPKSKEINLIAKMGIVTGSQDSVFEPDRNIEYNEALLMALRLIGYDKFVALYGGYPEGCHITVQKHRLFWDYYLTNEPTTRNILELLYAAVSENLMEITAIENGYDNVEVNKEETFLSKYFDIYYTEGNLTSDGIVDIKSTVVPERNQITIDSVKYLSDKNFSDCLGQNVICFYEDIGEGQKKAVYVAPTYLNNVVVMNSNDIYGFGDMTYEYKSESNKSAKIKVNDKMDIIRNFEVVTKINESTMLPQDGILKFIDNDGDRRYDVIIIKDYVSFVINSVNKTETGLAITPKEALNIGQINIILDGENDTLVLKSDGTKMDVEKIQRDMVASVVYTEENGQKIAKEVIICEDKLYGDLTGREDDVDSISFLIDDVPYKVTNSYEAIAKNSGTRYSANFYLDFFGNIVDIVETDMTMLDLAMGYVIEGYLDTERSDKTIQLRILTETGKIVLYDVNEKVTIDETPYNKKAVEAFEYLSGGQSEIKPMMVVYKLSENRKINYIDTAEEYTGYIDSNYYNRLALTCPMAKKYYQKEQLSFDGKITMDNNTKIFVIPQSLVGAEDEEFEVIRPSEVDGSLSYEVESYSLNHEKITADAVVMKASSQVMPSTSVAMAITNISKTMNSKGDETYALKLMGMKGEQKYITVNESIVTSAPAQYEGDTKTYNLEVGDIVRILTNKNGEINKIALVYDYSEGELKNGFAFAGSYFSLARAAKANVYRILGEYMQITDYNLDTLGDNEKLTLDKLENQRLSKFTVVKYVKNGSDLKFEVGSSKDLIAYMDNPNDYSKIIIYTHNALERVLFILD